MPMIIGEIKRYLRDNNAVRVSRSVRDLAYRALQAREYIARQEGREATVEDIVKNLSENGIDKTADEVTNALDAIAAPVSLYDPVYGDGGDPVYVMDQLRDDNEGEEIWLESISLREAIKGLSARERTILALRFYGGKTQMEIASEIGISQAQVSRLEKGAIERIKKQM
jgi:RNA polymerase sporulation-specific sigma factor